MKKNLSLFPIGVIFIFLIPLLWPLFQPGFFQSDDGNWMIIRLAGFHQALKMGQFPVRFLPTLNHNYGYPVLNFLYPLPFYIAETFHLAKIDLISSTKIVFILSFALGGLFIYLFSKKEFGPIPAIISAVVYTYFPYHVFDLYSRGSLGECLALGIAPGIFYFLSRYFDKRRSFDLILATVFLALLIISHNVVAFLFLPVVITYTLLEILKNKSPSGQKTIKHSLFALAGALSLSAFFWIPAIFELQYTRAASVQVSNYSTYFLNSPNYFLSIGLISLVLTLLVLIVFLIKKDWKNPQLLFWLAVTLISLFFSLSLSDVFWRLTPLPKLVQFPWRFLSVSAISISFGLGYLASKNKLLLVLSTTVALFLMIFSLKIFPARQNLEPESYYQTNDSTTTVQNEYMPRWVKSDPTNRPKSDWEVLSGQAQLRGNGLVLVHSPAVLQINKVYFPGWKAFVDDQEAKINYENNGLILISLTPGKHLISTSFGETPLRQLADLISIFSGVAIIFLLLRWTRLLNFKKTS